MSIGLELEFPSTFTPVRNAVRRGLDGIAIQLAIRRGITDENRLTDILFRERHKEIGGRRLRPNERGLIREWVTIRSGIVRPALAAARAAAAQPTTPVGSPPPAAAAGLGVLDGIRALSGREVAPTETNALRIVKAVAAYWAIPWCVPYTILEHEGGVGLFRHHDGVMQTIKAARETVLPRIPRDLKLAALGLRAGDATSDDQLARTLEVEFHRRLGVQIVAGTQELVTSLRAFNGYVALAFVAYNAGTGSANLMATRGKGRRRPSATPEEWERMCRAAATLLHQPVSAVTVLTGQWQCDANLLDGRPGPKAGWHKRYGVVDRTTKRSLIAYQYLRKVSSKIRRSPPAIACDASTHMKRFDGTGDWSYEPSRPGALDKLFDPGKLGRSYQKAAAGELSPIPDDGSPWKIAGGRLTKVPPLAP